MTSLGETLMAAGKLEEAAKIFQDVINYQTKKFGRSNETTLWPVSLLARCIGLGGNHKEAIKLFEEALPVMRTYYGLQDVDVQNCTNWLNESRAQVEESKETEVEESKEIE